MSGRFVVLLVIAALALGGGASALTGGSGGSASSGQVIRVVDGDTIHVLLDAGAKEKVRYIGTLSRLAIEAILMPGSSGAPRLQLRQSASGPEGRECCRAARSLPGVVG